MLGRTFKIAILCIVAIAGVALMIPTSFTSLVLTVAAVIGIIVVALSSMWK